MADIIFDPTGSIENFTNNINLLNSQNQTVMILACDANNFQKDLVDPTLLQSNMPIIGGVFPSIIYNTEKYDKGTLFIRLHDEMDIHIINDISQKDYESLDKDMEEQLKGFDMSIKTMFILGRWIGKKYRYISECVI